MKKNVWGVLCAVLLLACGCGQQQNAATTLSIDNKAPPITTAKTEVVATPTNSMPHEEIDAPTLSPLQAFTAVLLNEKPFLYIDQNRSEIHQGVSNTVVYHITDYLDMLTEDDKTTMSMPSFAVVDMDGDGLGEVVYQRSDYLGFIVLRYVDDKVIGYSINYRAMQDLKEDGTFLGTGGALISYIEKLRFLGEYLDNDCLANQYDQSYWIRGEPVVKEDYMKVADEFSLKPDARWRVYSRDAIDMWLGRDLEDQKRDAISEETTIERQTLLDSYANLLWFNYNTHEAHVSRDDNEQRYYDGWNTAMEELLTLSRGRLSDDESSALHDDQQRWLDVREVEEGVYAETDPATRNYHLGRMTQLRVYNLISLYCGDHFYD